MEQQTNHGLDEWVAETPSHWTEKPLSSLVENVVDKATSASGYIGLENIESGTGKRTLHANSESDGQLLSYQIGDVLFGKLRPYLAKVYLCEDSGACSSEFLVLRAKDVSNDFLKYRLLSPDFIDAINAHTYGVKMPRAKWSLIRGFKLQVPTMDEQVIIAEKITKTMSIIDRLIEMTTESINEHSRLKQSIITEAVTKGLNPDVKMTESGIEWIGEIPEHWRLTKIKYLLQDSGERSTTGKETPLSVTQTDGVIPSELCAIPNPTSNYLGNKVVKSGDLVFNKLKAHLGVFFVSQYDGIVSPDYAVYRAKNPFVAHYLQYVFHTNIYINEFKKRIQGVGAGLSRLYTGDLFQIYVALPPLDEIELVLSRISHTSDNISRLIKKKETLIAELGLYRQSTVYEYITGKKEVS